MLTKTPKIFLPTSKAQDPERDAAIPERAQKERRKSAERGESFLDWQIRKNENEALQEWPQNEEFKRKEEQVQIRSLFPA
jgi:hypothetical protein